MPVRTGTCVRRCVHTRAASHGEWVMKCCSALIAARIAQPAMHRLHGLPLAVVEEPVEILAGGRRCGRRLKHALKVSMNRPSRRRSARAESVVTDETVRNPGRQYKHNPLRSSQLRG